MARSRKSVDELIGAALAASDPAGPAAASDPADASAAADPSRPWAVAFSGGLDSTVLLHAVVRVAGPARVLALHVHHGLQPAADAWVAHGEAVASRLGIAFRALRARGAPARGDSASATKPTATSAPPSVSVPRSPSSGISREANAA